MFGNSALAAFSDTFLAVLVGRLAVLSYDDFGALVASKHEQFVQSTVAALLGQAETIDGILETAREQSSGILLPALLVLVCSVSSMRLLPLRPVNSFSTPYVGFLSRLTSRLG